MFLGNSIEFNRCSSTSHEDFKKLSELKSHWETWARFQLWKSLLTLLNYQRARSQQASLIESSSISVVLCFNFILLQVIKVVHSKLTIETNCWIENTWAWKIEFHLDNDAVFVMASEYVWLHDLMIKINTAHFTCFSSSLRLDIQPWKQHNNNDEILMEFFPSVSSHHSTLTKKLILTMTKRRF